MAGVARVFLDRAGGQQLPGSNSKVYADGVLIQVLFGPVKTHGDSPHNTPQMIEASTRVFASGIELCRDGDKASCGHRSTGSSKVFAT